MKLEIISTGHYRLLESYTFKYKGEVTIVPKGFEWDGASSPSIASWIIPKAYGTLIASCLHDYLCGLATCDEDRELADERFKYEIDMRGMSKTRSWFGYLGVRVGAFFGVGSNY